MLDLADFDERLVEKLRKAGDRWGRLTVALVAVRLSDPLVVAAHLCTASGVGVAFAPQQGDPHVSCRAVQAGERKAAEEQADALRAEVARLSALADFGGEWHQRLQRQIGETARVARERDEARDEVASLGQQIERLIAANRDQARQLRERRTQRPALVHEGEGIAIPETFLPTPDHPVALRVTGPGLVEYDGHELRITYDNPDGTTVPGGLGTDPRRPRPDWYPEDGVTLSYRELRQLIGLHLQRCTDDPYLAAAMRDGESPLHLAEVLPR